MDNGQPLSTWKPTEAPADPTYGREFDCDDVFLDMTRNTGT
jgi:hypothetical protein